MKNRSELREIIMKVLYQIEILNETKIPYKVEDLIKEQLEVENEFVNETIAGIEKNKKAIIELDNRYLNDWTMDRLNKVDKAIMLLGRFRKMFCFK